MSTIMDRQLEQPPQRPVRHDLDFSDDMRLVSRVCQREEKFRQRFLEVPPEEKLIDYYSCAFNKDYYLQQGALYVTSNFICFRSNIFGKERKLIIPTADVRQVQKINTFRLIPSGIVIVTTDHKYQFESFLNRHSAYETLKVVSEKRPAFVRLQGGKGQSEVPSARRFTKSQSSCSLERKEQDDDTREDFLRPLSATVMHDYVSQRSSNAAALSEEMEMRADVVDGSLAKNRWSQTEEKYPPRATSQQSSRDCQWDFGVPDEPSVSVRIPLGFLLRLGYFICAFLIMSAIFGLAKLFSNSPGPVSSISFPSEDSLPEAETPNIDRKALNDTLHLINSLCDVAHDMVYQMQRHLVEASQS